MATTTILCLMDVVGALSTGTLQNSLYLMDDNRPPGVSRDATSTLTTRVRAGDMLIWADMQMEIETDIYIAAIWGIPPDICVPARALLPETDVVYWYATVLRDFAGSVPYWMHFNVEGVPMCVPESSVLVCSANDPQGE